MLEFLSHAACRAAWGIEQRQHHRRHLPPRASRASGRGAPPVGDAEVGEGRRKGREVEVCAGFRSDGLGRRRLCVVVFGPAGGSPLARTMCSRSRMKEMLQRLYGRTAAADVPLECVEVARRLVGTINVEGRGNSQTLRLPPGPRGEMRR